MKRLFGMLRGDFKLQWRYGFWYAGVFVTLVWILIFSLIPVALVPRLIPFMLFVDLAGFGFFFIAGMVLFERDEGVLNGLVASPLRSGEYLISRLVSLTVLALAISLTTVYGVRLLKGAWPAGYHLEPVWLVVGTVLTSLLLVLVGFIAVAPYENMSHFILPSTLMVTVLQLPLLNYFDIFPSRLWWLVPSQPALWFLEAAVQPVEAGKLGLGAVYILGWIALAWAWGVRRFDRYIVRQEHRSS